MKARHIIGQERGNGMHPGKLKVRRYKKAGRSGKWMILLLLGVLAAAGGYLYRQGELPPLDIAPSPTLTPGESAAEEKTIVLPGSAWYALQLGVFEQESAAHQLAESFRSRGAGGAILSSPPYRVLAAAYESRADAQQVQLQLSNLHGVESYVHEIICPEVTLKLRGQRAQLSAISDACTAFSQGAERLSALSRGLDQHALGKEAVQAAMESEKNTFSALAERMSALFGPSAPEAVRVLGDALSEISDALAAARGISGETALGAQVKYCQLLCIIRWQEIALALSS